MIERVRERKRAREVRPCKGGDRGAERARARGNERGRVRRSPALRVSLSLSPSLSLSLSLSPGRNGARRALLPGAANCPEGLLSFTLSLSPSPSPFIALALISLDLCPSLIRRVANSSFQSVTFPLISFFLNSQTVLRNLVSIIPPSLPPSVSPSVPLPISLGGVVQGRPATRDLRLRATRAWPESRHPGHTAKDIICTSTCNVDCL